VLASTDVSVEPQPEAEMPLLVKLPPQLGNFFSEVGYMPTAFVEKRSAARMRVRCESVITTTFAPAFVRRTDKSTRVLVKDLSRTGIAVLTHHQMWPTETFQIELHRRKLNARVVRCRKLGEDCYEVGSLVVSIETPENEES
jgi:hypothetical protein